MDDKNQKKGGHLGDVSLAGIVNGPGEIPDEAAKRCPKCNVGSMRMMSGQEKNYWVCMNPQCKNRIEIP